MPRFSGPIRQSPYNRGFFLKKMIYENFVEILETVRNREVPFVLFFPVENTVIVN